MDQAIRLPGQSFQMEASVLLGQIEVFLDQTGMAATKFGRLAAHDPRFVLDLRMGRTPRNHTARRIEHFMNAYSCQNAF